MCKANFKTVLLLIAISFFSYSGIAQVAAIAYPVENIVIDGSLKDWPAHLPKYVIDHGYGPRDLTKEDFSANFCLGYNEEQGALFVGLEVIDDQHIGINGQSHMTQDHALVYIDRSHDRRGGTPFYYVAAEEYLELLKKEVVWDPEHADITLENAEVEVKHSGNRTVYEWKITLGKGVKANKVLGLDHFVIDQDPLQTEQKVYLWKDGFAKSSGSQRLGDVMLLANGADTGSLQGFFHSDEKVEIEEFRLFSENEPEFWVKVAVDSTGHFKTTLPSGTYHFEPSKIFTSPVNSTGFKQNTRRLQYKFPQTVEVVKDKMTTQDSIKVGIKPQPDLKASGVLYSGVQNIEEEADLFIQEWMDYLKIPAVSVAIIKDNKLVYDKNFGIKNTLTNEPIDERTLFEAASISKAVFAVMALRLAERGIIDLDKPLYEYLPFPNLEGDERYRLLTARIILNHQSGLPNWAWNGPGSWESGGPISLNFKPGTAFGYSGEAFNYLGRVLEKITGKTLPEIYKDEIAAPFKLRNTFYNYSDPQQKNTAIGHYHQYPNFKGKEYLPSPASSVVTNAHDFHRFVHGLMNEKHLKQASYQLLYQPHTILEESQKIYDPEIPQYVSHGFFVQNTERGKLMAHGGNNGDYDCKFVYNPEKKVGFVAFTNSNLGDELVRKLEVFLLH